jgi:uncharacterized protein YndB with AHSA1/START domain
MKKTDPPIIVEQSFNVSPETVWKAITEHKQMIKWYFDNIPAFFPVAGFETDFLIENEERKFTHLWRITEVEQQKKITYEWRFEEYPGVGLVVFELTGEGSGTKLTLTNYVIEDFPDEVPEFKRESCHGGWTYFINERLKEYLEK